MSESADNINAVLEDLANTGDELRRLGRRVDMIMASGHPTIVKLRTLMALRHAVRLQSQRAGELFETLHSLAAAAGIEA